MILIALIALIFPMTSFASDLDWTPILTWFQGLAPWVNYILMGLGTLTTVGTFVDSVIPDEKDHGFMKKLLALPIIGSLLQALAKFSPFNYKQ